MKVVKTTANKVTDRDERLPAEIARRNWWILGFLLLLSLFWRSLPVTLGVLGGGLVAIGGYYWLHRSLQEALHPLSPGAAKRFKLSYIFRLAALAASLFILIVIVRVHPLALIAGLSVVMLNMLLTILKRID